MAVNIFIVLILIALLLISKNLAVNAIKNGFRIISFLSAAIVIYRNKELVVSMTKKVFTQSVPYLINKIVFILNTILAYAVNYSEQVLNYLTQR